MRTGRENFQQDVHFLIAVCNELYTLTTRNLKLARQLRDSWKEVGLLTKIGNATYHVDKYYGEGDSRAKRAGWVIYVGRPKCIGLKTIVILSAYTGLGGQRLHVWEVNEKRR